MKKTTYTQPTLQIVKIEAITLLNQVSGGEAGAGAVSLGKEDFTPISDDNAAGSLWED